MKTIDAQELSDAQLEAISGGCYRPEPKSCDYEKKYENYCDYDYDYDYDYDCHRPKKKYCGESSWEKLYERCHDYYSQPR